MAVDIYHSRRCAFKECTYWLRDEKISTGDLTKWVLENKPAGIFYAKEISPLSINQSQLNNVVLYDSNRINLMTDDEVEDLVVGCVVQYLGHLWFVDNIQKQLHMNESEYGDDRTTLMSLRR